MLKHQISSNEQNLKHENLEKIEKISHFDYGWNGNGGLKFTREAIDAFRRIIDGLNRQPKIAPTGRNSLFMQYESNDGGKLVFEVSVNKTEQIYMPNGEYKADVQIYTDNISNKINRAVEEFYQS